MLDILRKHPPKTVRIAAIGPLTNIALAWQKDPETFVRVAGISVMGGALDVPGNVSQNGVRTAELIHPPHRRPHARNSTRLRILLPSGVYYMMHKQVQSFLKII